MGFGPAPIIEKPKGCQGAVCGLEFAPQARQGSGRSLPYERALSGIGSTRNDRHVLVGKDTHLRDADAIGGSGFIVGEPIGSVSSRRAAQRKGQEQDSFHVRNPKASWLP